VRKFGTDDVMFELAVKIFSKMEYVSVGLLQMKLKISYFKARSVLDRLIEEGYCEQQIGAYPCRIIKISKLN
jgi:predicted HTH transcriptional regulator